MAKTKSHDPEIRSGLEALRQAGIPVDEPSPALVPRLQERFDQEPQIDLAIVFALGRIAETASVDALAAMATRSRDKALKKEIRRSLFKLSQKGLTVPETKTAGTSAAAPLFKANSDIEAYMSAVDGTGGRLLWIAKPQAGHGLQTLQAMVSDREGLLRVGGAQIRRKELHNIFRQIKEKHGINMISVPWEYADEMIYQAHEKARAQGRSGLEKFHELRALIGTGKPKPQEHPIYRRLSADSARDGDWREQSRQLLEEPELQFWFLDEDWVKPYLSQLEEAKTSRLVLNPVQKEERFAGIVRDAVKAFCAGEIGAVLQRRMEDMALYIIETGREASAKLSLAVAVQISTGDPGPLDISFLTGLVQKSFGFYLSQEKTKQADEPSFIVKP
ncbi:MAG: hypothetical protein WD688_01610 [Candidatus Binatia bacterium]